MPKGKPNPDCLRPLKPEELERGSFRKEIGTRYDRLLTERKKLERELEKFSYIDYSEIFVNPDLVSDEKIQEIAEMWKRKLRDETEYLTPFYMMGIELFTDDLESQPGFPDLQIKFGSKKIFEKRVRELNNTGGLAYGRNNLVEILDNKLPIRSQLACFLQTGAPDPASKTLIHELIHISHYLRTRNNVSKVLTESHAYSVEMHTNPKTASMREITEILTKDKEKGGLYEIGTDEAIDGISSITGLRAMGEREDVIADCVAEYELDNSDQTKESNGRKLSLFSYLKEEYCLDDLDIQALNDIFRIFSINQSLKAQLALYKILDANFTKKELSEYRMQNIPKHICFPYYYKDGQLFPSHQMMQYSIYPVTDEYPYDPDGKRTGIIFGMFQNKKGKFDFRIGRFEAKDKDSKINFAKNPQEVDKYLKNIADQSKIINLKDKIMLVSAYLQITNPFQYPILIKVLQVLINKEEAIKIFKSELPHHIEILNILKKEINTIEEYMILNEEDPSYKMFLMESQNRKYADDIKKIKVYKHEFDTINDFMKIFNIELNEVDSEFAEFFDKLQRKFTALVTKVDNEEKANAEHLANLRRLSKRAGSPLITRND